MSVIILGSRNYQPLESVDVALDAACPAAIVGMGLSPVAERAVAWGKAHDLPSRAIALDQHHRALIEQCRQPDARVIVFCARQPESELITEGTQLLMWRLDREGIAYRAIGTAISGTACDLITRLDAEVAKALARDESDRRRVVIVQRALKLASLIIDQRDAYTAKLDAGWAYMAERGETDRRTAEWSGWLANYTALCAVLERAKAMLGPAATLIHGQVAA